MPNIQDKIKKAREMGMPEETIQRLAARDMALEQKKPSLLESALPVIGGIAGASLLAPLPGGVIAGGAAGSAAGEWLRQKMTGEKDSRRIATEAAFGLAGGAVGKGIGLVGGKVLPKVGGMLAGKGGQVALRALRPRQSQQKFFLRKTGEKLEKFVLRKGLLEEGTGQVDELIRTTQKLYDDLAIRSGVKIPTTNLYSKFTSKIKELRAVPDEDAKAIASGLASRLKILKKSFGNKEIGIDRLVNLRRTLDKFIPKGKFIIEDPLTAGKRKVIRDIYKETIDTATKGRTAILGNELKALHAYRDIAQGQQFLGKGTLPFGLIPTIAGTAGGGYGYYKEGRGGMVKNALLAAGLVSVANNPTVINLIARGMIATGERMTTVPTLPAVSQFLGQTTTRQLGPLQGVPQTPQEMTFEQPTPKEYTDEQGFKHTASGIFSPQGQWKWNQGLGKWEASQQAETWKPSKESLEKAMVIDLMSGGKNLAKIKTVITQLYPESGKIPATIQGQIQTATAGLGVLEQLEGIWTQIPAEIKASGPYIGKIRGIKGTISAIGEGNVPAATYMKTREAFLSLIARAAGERGVLTNYDVDRIRKALPSFYTSPAVAAASFQTVKDIINTAIERTRAEYETFPTSPVEVEF